MRFLLRRARRETCGVRFAIGLASVVFACAAHAAEPRFGDSTWVAPHERTRAEDQQAVRVAPRDHERGWETALRAPFRLAFLPLRVLARGTEAGVGFVAPHIMKEGDSPRQGIRLAPRAAYVSSEGPAVGPGIAFFGAPGPDGHMSLSGTWSTRDARHADARLEWPMTGPVTLLAAGRYTYRPSRRFYGIGNDAPPTRTAYLEERGRIDGTIALGKDPLRQVRATVGYDEVSAREGYNATTHLEDVFSVAQAPGFGDRSRVVAYGVGGDLAALDDPRRPGLGAHGRVELRRVRDAGDTDLAYDQWHVEGRGYIPVFARRRVIAIRLVYAGVEPREGSSPLPFYRLVESDRETRFAGYASGRFRDRRLALAHAEYRWQVWRNVSALALYEWGEVAPTASALSFARRHTSVGGGFRYAASPTSVIRMDLARGEGRNRVTIDVKGDF